MGVQIPASLVKRLSMTQADQVGRWWHSVSPANRRTLRRDPGRPPIGVVARFVEPGDEREVGNETCDFYEYLVNHEVYLEDGRTFRICSAHPEARAVLARGLLPVAFACPRASLACPLRTLLDEAGGCDVRLALREAPPSEAGARG